MSASQLTVVVVWKAPDCEPEQRKTSQSSWFCTDLYVKLRNFLFLLTLAASADKAVSLCWSHSIHFCMGSLDKNISFCCLLTMKCVSQWFFGMESVNKVNQTWSDTSPVAVMTVIQNYIMIITSQPMLLCAFISHEDTLIWGMHCDDTVSSWSNMFHNAQFIMWLLMYL